MRSLVKLNKFNRRYEVDLFGKIGLSHNFKMLKFIKKVSSEKRRRFFFRHYHWFRKKRLSKGYRNSFYNPVFIKNYNYKPYNPTVFFPRSHRNKYNFDRKFKRVPYKKKRFLYRIDIEEPRRKRLKTSLSRDFFLINRKLRSFYANIKRLQLRRYANNYKFHFKTKQIKGFSLKSYNYVRFKSKNFYSKISVVDSFLSILERRLDMFLYRANFAKSIYHARHLIRYNKVLVNFKTISFCSYLLKSYDVVSLNKEELLKLRTYLINKLSRRLVLSYFPVYLNVSYKLLCGFFIKNPTLKSVPFPFKINLKKWLGLSKMHI